MEWLVVFIALATVLAGAVWLYTYEKVAIR